MSEVPQLPCGPWLSRMEDVQGLLAGGRIIPRALVDSSSCSGGSVALYFCEMIKDEFTNLPISKQRKYQLRKERDRECVGCGRRAATGCLRCAACSYRMNMRRKDTYGNTNNRARRVVVIAFMRGKLKRSPCEVCGKLGQAHHKDYSRPLDITWLCHKHHCEAEGKRPYKDRPILIKDPYIHNKEGARRRLAAII